MNYGIKMVWYVVSHANWMSIRSTVADPYPKQMNMRLFFLFQQSVISRTKRNSIDWLSPYPKRHWSSAIKPGKKVSWKRVKNTNIWKKKSSKYKLIQEKVSKSLICEMSRDPVNNCFFPYQTVFFQKWILVGIQCDIYKTWVTANGCNTST